MHNTDHHWGEENTYKITNIKFKSVLTEYNLTDGNWGKNSLFNKDGKDINRHDRELVKIDKTKL
jgi:hypothetical protein